MSSEALQQFFRVVMPEFGNTLIMLGVSMILSIFFGFVLAIVLIITKEDGLKPNRTVYKIMDFLINVVRSFPFIILVVAIIPFTRALVGTSIGVAAAIVPLTIAGSATSARLVETSLDGIPKGLVQAALACGASTWQIVFKVLIKEAVPAIVSGFTILIVSLLGSTAMAGMVGAGGLGAVALIYGYQSFNQTIMYGTVIILIILVQCIQTYGSHLYRKLK
jgi:D-methionine transport system permease protein